MTTRVRRVIREPLQLQRLRRGYRKQQGTYRKTYLAAVNGSVLGTKAGHLWVHDAASADISGNVTHGPAYQLPIKSGAAIAHRPNWKVNVITIDGNEYIESMDFDELVRANFDPHQTNALDPSLHYPLIETLQNLQAFPNDNATVRIMPSIYRKADGTYSIFKAIDVDILTGNVPSSGNQVVACIWLKTDNTAEVTVSSEEPVSTLLKVDPTTALTLINECASAASAGAMGIWSFILYDDTTAITGTNKFHDLRGIVGIGGTSGFGASTTKTLASDTFDAGDDRNIVVAAESGTADDLIEITGLSVGDKILLRADAGDTITVKHNDAGATIKILIQDDADFVLDEVHPLELVLVETNQLAQVYDENTGSGGAPSTAQYVTTASDGTLSNEIVVSGFGGSVAKNGVFGGGAADREFNNALSGETWSPSSPSAVDANSTRLSHLYALSTDTTERFLYWSWSPAGAFEAIAHISLFSDLATATSHNAALYIASSTNNERIIIMNNRTTGMTRAVAAYTYSAGAYTQRGSNSGAIPSDVIVKITRDGSNNVAFYWSTDGYGWQFIASLSFTLTVARLGYRISSNSAGNYGFYSDFLRTNV